MAKFFNKLDDSQIAFIEQQKLFFTATAPLSGRINLSPKGMNTFRIFDASTVGYLDLTGSGNETAAHIAENGRITIMFCSFADKPLILRLYGRGEVITPRHPDWSTHIETFQPIAGMRQIILMRVDSVQTSCGYAVPMYHYEGERDTLERWAEKKGEEGIQQYWEERNQTSIDGLPTHLLDQDL
ncbi:pyridoxamine 5'-phosphate oxidase family protein [Kaarinaea lacus]